MWAQADVLLARKNDTQGVSLSRNKAPMTRRPMRRVQQFSYASRGDPQILDRLTHQEASPMLQAIIADDHPSVRMGTRVVLERQSIEVVAEASSTDESMAALASFHADIIVTDFVMPGVKFSDGFGYLSAISKAYPAMKIIVLTMINRRTFLQKMLTSGAFSLVDKTSPMEQFEKSIYRAVLNKPFTSPSFLELIDTPDATERPDQDVLSARERQVLRLIAGGKSVTDISLMLNTSIKTVSTQKRSLMRKLKLHADLDIVSYVRDRLSVSTSRAKRSRTSRKTDPSEIIA
jgi:two-component system capsular synthesis response regulator RcsB